MDEERKNEEITEDDLVAALLAAFQPETDEVGMTTNELVDKTGHSHKWVLGKLRRLRKDGRLQVVRQPSETIDGRTVMVPAYVLSNGRLA